MGKDEKKSGKPETPPGGPEDNKTDFPDAQKEFAAFLKKYGVGKDDDNRTTIAEYLSTTKGTRVFEDPDLLARGLLDWTETIGPVKRRQLIQHWCRLKNVAVTDTALEVADAAKGKEGDARRKAETGKGSEDELRWTVEQDARGNWQVVVTKNAEQRGTTYEEAKRARDDLMREKMGGEDLVVFDESSGKYIPNVQSPWVRDHMEQAKAMARDMNQSIGTDQPADPWEVVAQHLANEDTLRERLTGGAAGGGGKGTLLEQLEIHKQLNELSGGGQNAVLLQKVSDLERQVRESQQGGQNSAVEALKQQLDSLREDMHKRDIEARDTLIANQRAEIDGLKRSVGELAQRVDAGNRQPGMSSYDLMARLVDKMPDRTDIRQLVLEAAGKGQSPSSRSPEERAKLLGGATKEMEEEAQILDVANFVFGVQ